ncbi:fibrohexamerin-like [Bombyx mori]|uniref:Fibrohexamerin-like n=1 Tax=Bombyx mori TaxID=7091 RepID=A0A8R2AF64_BOMMO|nr:fibrohexamerin-like [Bombyx mori]
MKLMLCLCLLSFFGLTVADEVDCESDLDPADDPRNIERPCPNFDLDCIRKYFSSNSKCQITLGPVPDPLLLNNYRLDIANSNITAQFNNVSVRGLNGNIVEFYINRKTEKLVLATEVKSLAFDSPQVVFKYNRKGKEPIVRGDCVDCEYGAATFTAVFPSICDLDLSKAEVFTYVEDSNPRYKIGSRLFSISDSVALNEFLKFITSMSENIQEKFISQGRIFMANYIEYNICDFGLNLACK